MHDPYLDMAMHGWIKNTARQNYWRIAHWHELEDLIEEGYVCYYKCRKHYSEFAALKHPLPQDKRRFMALVQSTYINYIHDLAKRRTKTPEVCFSQCFSDEALIESLEALLPEQPEEATIRLLIASAPKELLALIELLIRDGKEAVRYLRVSMNGRPKLRETTNEHYCRRLGLDPSKVDLFELARNHLGVGK